jgi:hypothetical protein
VADYTCNSIRRLELDGTSAAVNGATSVVDVGPTGVAVGGGGVVYIADHANHRIRQIAPLGFVVSTIAGSGLPATADGWGLNASFYFPEACALSAAPGPLRRAQVSCLAGTLQPGKNLVAAGPAHKFAGPPRTGPPAAHGAAPPGGSRRAAGGHGAPPRLRRAQTDP